MAAGLLPAFAASATILADIAFSTAGQLPSSAETSSPLATTGHDAFFQAGPLALCSTASGSSSSAAKKSRHSPSTEAGFSRKRSCICSR